MGRCGRDRGRIGELNVFLNFFLPPFSTAVNRGEVYDSALPLMTHPSTELSRSHNKNRAAGHNFNQTVLLPYEEQPGSITEKLLKTNNWPRRHTDFKPTPCASGYMRLSTSAEQLQLDVRLNGTRSSGSVISHPTCCHRAPRRKLLSTEPTLTDRCPLRRARHRKVSKAAWKSYNRAAKVVLFCSAS